MLSRVYRAKLMEGMKSLYHNGELVFFPNNIKPLEQPEAFQDLVDELFFNKDWVVYSKRVFKSAKHVIKYLGRYTHKITIYANRLRHSKKTASIRQMI